MELNTKLFNKIEKSLEGTSYERDFFIAGLAESVTIFKEQEHMKSKPVKISKAYGVLCYLSAFILHFDRSFTIFHIPAAHPLNFNSISTTFPISGFFQNPQMFYGITKMFPIANFFRQLKLCVIDLPSDKPYRKDIMQYYIYQLVEYLCKKCECPMDEFVRLIDHENDMCMYPWNLGAVLDYNTISHDSYNLAAQRSDD